MARRLTGPPPRPRPAPREDSLDATEHRHAATARNPSAPDTAGSADGREPVVPAGVAIASTWAWRTLVIAAGVALLVWLLRYLSEVAIPVAVGALFAALLAPAVGRLQRWGLPRGPAAGITLVGAIVVVAGLLTLVGTQISGSWSDLTDQVGAGLTQLRDLAQANFGITDADIHQAMGKAKNALSSAGLGARAAHAGSTVTHFFAGAFIALFTTFFFLFEGETIWAWLVRLLPRRARAKTDSAGRRAWLSLVAYVRATIIVAFVDAIGISIGAFALGLPLVGAIGILVFVGAFITIVGAFVSGLVAVLIALVTHGPIGAIIMLAVVLAVQQIEAHVLQPFLLGRLVRVHPLAVILAIATGIVVAGIIGALIAVPVAAMANAIVHHLAGHDPPPTHANDPTGAQADDEAAVITDQDTP